MLWRRNILWRRGLTSCLLWGSIVKHSPPLRVGVRLNVVGNGDDRLHSCLMRRLVRPPVWTWLHTMNHQHGICEFNHALRMIGIQSKQAFCRFLLNLLEFQEDTLCHCLQHLFLEWVLQDIHMLGLSPLIWVQETLEFLHDFGPINCEIKRVHRGLSTSRLGIVKPLSVVFVKSKCG